MSSKRTDYLKDIREVDNLLDEIRNEVLSSEHVQEKMDELKEYSLQTYIHGMNVCRRVALVGILKNYDKQRVIEMATAGLLLDIGYLKIPLKYIEKEKMLQDDEFEEVKKHVIYSVEIAKEIGLPDNIVEMIENHHERNNGYGYLNRVALSDLPRDVQTVAACDCFEAFREPRPYRESHTTNNAVEYLKYQVGTDFDLDVVLDITNTLMLIP